VRNEVEHIKSIFFTTAESAPALTAPYELME